MAEVLAYLTAAAIAAWAVSHAIPTRQVVARFEPAATTTRAADLLVTATVG